MRVSASLYVCDVSVYTYGAKDCNGLSSESGVRVKASTSGLLCALCVCVAAGRVMGCEADCVVPVPFDFTVSHMRLAFVT